MKRIISFLSILIVFALSSSSAFADSDFALRELARSACPNAVGSPIINVEQKVINDADSGVGGNYWALDHYQRNIVVYKTKTANTYCAIVKYGGNFVTFAGASPNNTGTVGAGIEGDMKGGYRGLVTGTLKASPSWKTHGNVGKFDYACDALGNCPGRVSWLAQYFDPGFGFDYSWWGWKYTTDHNGTWINKMDGNIGDITGLAPKDNGNNDKNDNNHEN